LDLEKIRGLLAETYAKKPALVDSNMKAIQLGSVRSGSGQTQFAFA
jgi:hypothetical protein